jgi:hypothetical protein
MISYIQNESMKFHKLAYTILNVNVHGAQRCVHDMKACTVHVYTCTNSALFQPFLQYCLQYSFKRLIIETILCSSIFNELPYGHLYANIAYTDLPLLRIFSNLVRRGRYSISLYFAYGR